MKFLTGLHLLLLLIIGHRLMLGQNSWPEYMRLQEKIVVQSQINEQLELRNKALQVEIDDLKTGHDAIEERARHELGLIKPGEIFFRVLDYQENIPVKAL